jgi:hypothetical protein
VQVIFALSKDREMLSKGRVFAAVAAFCVFAAFTGTDAHPGLTGLALQQDNTAITKVDYYYSGQYDDRDGYYYRGNPFEIPVIVLGGVTNLIGGVFGVFDDESSYSQPCYVSTYYGSPYYYKTYRDSSFYNSPYYLSTYYGSPYYYERYRDSSLYNSPYGRGGYYLDSRYDRDRPNYRSHREHELYNGYDYSYYYNVGFGRYR